MKVETFFLVFLSLPELIDMTVWTI